MLSLSWKRERRPVASAWRIVAFLCTSLVGFLLTFLCAPGGIRDAFATMEEVSGQRIVQEASPKPLSGIELSSAAPAASPTMQARDPRPAGGMLRAQSAGSPGTSALQLRLVTTAFSSPEVWHAPGGRYRAEEFSANVEDTRVEFQILIKAVHPDPVWGSGFWVFPRKSGESLGYRVGYLDNRTVLFLSNILGYLCVREVDIRLGSAPFKMVPGSWYHVIIDTIGEQATVYIDGNWAARFGPIPNGKGSVGITLSGMTATIANVKVYSIEGGRTPPLPPPRLERANIERWIQARKRLLPPNPPYLYSTDTVSGSIATVWMDLTGNLLNTQDLRAKYDEFYYAAVDYRAMEFLALMRAERALRDNTLDRANAYVAEADRYLQLFGLSNQGAIEAYNGNIDAAARFARGIYDASMASTKFGAAVVLGPWASRAADGVFLATDFLVDLSELGLDEAVQRAVRTALADVMFDELRVASLGGKTLSQFLTTPVTQAIGSSRVYPILNEILGEPEFQRAFMTVLAKSAKNITNELAKELTKRVSAELLRGLP